jgi:hypothetical protein
MMAKAKEKPIIFSTPLIPAIQNLKPGTWPPEPIDPGKPWKWQTRRLVTAPCYKDKKSGKLLYQDKNGERYPMEKVCPYPPGTRLWVRETWTILQTKYFYRADIENPTGHYRTKWRPSIHMPREAARLFLEVKSARVERLQEISNEDILAEGINDLGSYGANYDYFANEIWDNINAKRGHPWENNDWVWVYEFMRANGP